MKKIAILLIAIIAMSCSSQKKNVPDNFDYGTVENGIYTNEYFDMVLKFDPSWEVQNQERLDQLVEQGGEIVYGDNEELKKNIKASEINTANLLTMFKHEIGAQVTFNPSLALIAENTNNFPGLKTGVDYLVHVKDLLSQTQMDYIFSDDIIEKTIGKSNFYVMHVELDYMGRIIKQDYLTTIINGFSLSMVISYSNDEEKAELYEVIDAIEI